MDNSLPTSETDFLCARCKRWCDASQAAGSMQRPSNAGVSVILDVGRAVSGQSTESRAWLICRSCVDKRKQRSKVYATLLVGLVIAFAVALLAYWLRT